MAFLGNQPPERYTSVTKDTFSGDGSTVAFTLSRIATTNGVEVFVENVQQEPTAAYSISGTTLTFTAAPVTGSSNIYVIHRNPTAATVTIPDGQAINCTEFTSNGIDDNATSTAMTIDSSGNVLVGTTDSNPSGNNVEGISLQQAQGQIQASNDSGTALNLNRKTSDGTIINFRKDGTTVGSIGTNSSRTYIGSGSSQSGIKFNTNAVVPVSGTDGANSDGTYSLGVSSARFSDLYLSGGVYLGGTGSANYLDDYEIGSWTTTFGASGNVTGTPTLSYAQYVKVGNLVMIQGQVGGLSITSTGVETGVTVQVPFVMNAGSQRCVGSAWENNCRSHGAVLDSTGSNDNEIYILFPPELVTNTGATSIHFSLTYRSS